MPVKPKLYYAHLGKSHYTYGERAFYCPACDQQFESIDEYHKHVAQVCTHGFIHVCLPMAQLYGNYS